MVAEPARFADPDRGNVAGQVRRAPGPVPGARHRTFNEGPVRDLLLREGIRAVLAVPLLRDEQVIGALVVRRKVAGEFAASVIRCCRPCAGQSVLAIENARLFREIAEKGKQLEVVEPAEVAVPRQHVARAAHAAERDHRRHRDAAGGRARPQTGGRARAAGPRAPRRQAPARADQRHPRSVQDRGRQDGYAPRDVRDRAAGRRRGEDHRQRWRRRTATSSWSIARRTSAPCTPTRRGCARRCSTCASNATKFTENGTVTIGARRGIEAGREWVTIAVTDTGIGMTPEQIGQLFQEFVQADASTTRKYGGTGLGLAISRRFCQMMGGDITVTSELGRGSTFTIRLPAEVRGRAARRGGTDAVAARPVQRPPRPDGARRRRRPHRARGDRALSHARGLCGGHARTAARKACGSRASCTRPRSRST